MILIGDAPANTQDDVKENRAGRGEDYWKKTKFKDKTHYGKEVALLKQKGIPIHAFFVHTWAQPNFEEMAKATGGRSAFLDINSSSGAELLTNLVTEEVLRNVGGDQGDSLVDEYRSKFAKAYI